MENQELVSKKASEKKNTSYETGKPTSAFVTASWVALFVGMVAYCIGLWNANMWLNEKGYYFAILIFGLFSVISVQKSVRDKQEGIPVTEAYHTISWITTFVSILLLIIGLWNADLALSEKGFYGMAFTLSLYASITVQKNVRDLKLYNESK